MTGLRNITLLALAVFALALASPAAAQSPVDDAYSTDPPQSQRLPFSGLDLGLIAAGGALFVIAGFGLRRAVRSEA